MSCGTLCESVGGKYDRKLQRYLVNLGSQSGNSSGGNKIRTIMNDFLVDFCTLQWPIYEVFGPESALLGPIPKLPGIFHVVPF